MPVSRISLPALAKEGRKQRTSRSLLLLRPSGNRGQHEPVHVVSRVCLNSKAGRGRQVLGFASFKMKMDPGGSVALRGVRALAPAFEAKKSCCREMTKWEDHEGARCH